MEKLASVFKGLNPLFVDLETYWGSGCNLKALSYTECVNHPSFEVQIMSATTIDGFSESVLLPEIKETVEAIDWGNTLLICHNTRFDAYVLKEKFGVNAAGYCCTQDMANVLLQNAPHDLETLGVLCGWDGPAKSSLSDALVNTYNRTFNSLTDDELQSLIAYADNDVEICKFIAEKLVEQIPETELKLIDHTLKLWINPQLVLNTKKLEEAKKEDKILTDNKVKECIKEYKLNMAEAELKVILKSGPKFANLLKNRFNVEPPLKTSPSNPSKKTYAFSKDDLGYKQLYTIEGLSLLLDTKIAVSSSIMQTRSKRFLKTAELSKGLMPVCYVHHSAHTGRIGGSNKTNQANLPRIVKAKPKPTDALRKSLEAPPGHVLTVVDSSNIEARLNTWFCEEELSGFRTPKFDPYADLATRILGRKITKDSDPVERQSFKSVFLGCGYGLGWMMYRINCAVGFLGAPPRNYTVEQAQEHVYGYRRTFPKIPEMWNTLNGLIPILRSSTTSKVKCIELANGEIRLPSGRTLQYPNLEFTEEGEWIFPKLVKSEAGKISILQKKIYGGKLLENIIQALARDIVMGQMLEIEKEVGRVAMHTYDEVVIVSPEHKADDDLKQMIEIMSTPPQWCKDLPLAAEGGWAVEYSK